jgi:transposase
MPVGKVVQVIFDNYATHKHPKVIQWLGRHPRFTFQFRATSSSWINAVEGFFAALTKRRVNHGIFPLDHQFSCRHYMLPGGTP